MSSVLECEGHGGCTFRCRESTPHQQQRDGPLSERQLLLSGTFLAFHLRKMSDSQNVRNTLVNNKFLGVTEHILSHFPDETTEVKRLDQAHTANHVKSQAQTQCNSPQIVCFCSTPSGNGGW